MKLLSFFSYNLEDNLFFLLSTSRQRHALSQKVWLATHNHGEYFWLWTARPWQRVVGAMLVGSGYVLMMFFLVLTFFILNLLTAFL